MTDKLHELQVAQDHLLMEQNRLESELWFVHRRLDRIMGEIAVERAKQSPDVPEERVRERHLHIIKDPAM